MKWECGDCTFWRKEKCDAFYSKHYRREREDNDTACSLFKQYIDEDDETFEENKKLHFLFNVVVSFIFFVVILIATESVLIALIVALTGCIRAWFRAYFSDWT